MEWSCNLILGKEEVGGSNPLDSSISQNFANYIDWFAKFFYALKSYLFVIYFSFFYFITAQSLQDYCKFFDESLQTKIFFMPVIYVITHYVIAHIKLGGNYNEVW